MPTPLPTNTADGQTMQTETCPTTIFVETLEAQSTGVKMLEAGIEQEAATLELLLLGRRSCAYNLFMARLQTPRISFHRYITPAPFRRSHRHEFNP